MDKSPKAVAVNPYTNMIYVANAGSDSVSMIDPYNVSKYTEGSIAANTAVGKAPQAVTVNPNTNMIYVANFYPNSVSVIDGTSGKVLANNVTVGKFPQAVAVNPYTNMIYVANSGSDSVSVIDGSINNIVAGVTFNIHPFNAGHITCNNDISTNVYVRIRFGTQCKAEANSGFVFSSWSENLGHNSSKTMTTSPISDSWTSLLNAIGLLNDNSSTFKISQYGNFIANFREAPSPIPPAYLLAIFGFILSTICTIHSTLDRWI